MAKHWRILGMSLLALIGILAVNASAAQAKWLILVKLAGGTVTSVKEIKVKGTGEAGYLLSANGNQIYCSGSTGEATATLSEEDKKLSGSATVTFTGCVDKAFETCTIHSVGQVNGTIVASGSGIGEMTGEEVYTKVTGPGGEFTTIQYLGEECPLNEANEKVTGKAKITLLTPLTLAELHKIDILGEGLKLGNTNAELHMLDEKGVKLDVILGSIKEAGNREFAVHLCNLPSPC